MSQKFYCMVMRVNIDCNCCYKRLRRTLLKMQELESHLIERQQCRISVCGEFVPQAVAKKMRKAINRRVEILDIKQVDIVHDNSNGNNNNNKDNKIENANPDGEFIPDDDIIYEERRQRCRLCFCF